MRQQNKSHWYSRNNLLKYGIIIIITIFIMYGLWKIIIMPCTILNTFKSYNKISDKAKYFGSIYGSIISSFLTLIGVAASLIFTYHQTKRSNQKANDRFKKASESATKRFKHNVYIGIIENNAKELSDLNRHIQTLDTSFIQVTKDINNLQNPNPTPKNLLNAVKIIINPSFKNKLKGIIKIVSNSLANNLNNIQEIFYIHKTFNEIYGYQLKELFDNLPNTKGFNKQDNILKRSLSNLSNAVKELHNNYNKLLSSKTQNDINKNIDYLNKYILITHKPLAKLNSLSFKFGKNMKNYVKNLK